MKRKGVLDDPERFKLVRQIKIWNEVRPMMKALMRGGEVKQTGMGGTWWEKSITFMSRIRAQTSKAVKGTWQKLVGSRDNKENQGAEIEH
jgi:hypothetical protein